MYTSVCVITAHTLMDTRFLPLKLDTSARFLLPRSMPPETSARPCSLSELSFHGGKPGPLAHQVVLHGWPWPSSAPLGAQLPCACGLLWGCRAALVPLPPGPVQKQALLMPYPDRPLRGPLLHLWCSWLTLTSCLCSAAPSPISAVTASRMERSVAVFQSAAFSTLSTLALTCTGHC